MKVYLKLSEVQNVSSATIKRVKSIVGTPEEVTSSSIDADGNLVFEVSDSITPQKLVELGRIIGMAELLADKQNQELEKVKEINPELEDLFRSLFSGQISGYRSRQVEEDAVEDDDVEFMEDWQNNDSKSDAALVIFKKGGEKQRKIVSTVEVNDFFKGGIITEAVFGNYIRDILQPDNNTPVLVSVRNDFFM